MRSWTSTTAMTLALIATPTGGQQQGEKPQLDVVSVTHFTGPDIPDFVAWQEFFLKADHVYRLGLGYYKNWVRGALAISAFLEDDPEFSKELLRLLPDQGMLVRREGERLKNEIALNYRMRQRGEMSQEERHRRLLELTRQEVCLVQKAHEELHAAVMNSKTPHREAIWARIVEYVHVDIKNSIGITSDNTPGDIEHCEVYLEFREVDQKMKENQSGGIGHGRRRQSRKRHEPVSSRESQEHRQS